MADSTGGMGAEVGVRKMDDDGNVTDTSGSASPSRFAYVLFYLMSILSLLGIWKVIELVPF